ncbi:MAG: GNAT family N-acetyltransferase [Clostridia bacterium]|nr:GNAT family N-acetyltransferase [Clostridia bacterium]
MTCGQPDSILIRPMNANDPQAITDAEAAQGWHVELEKQLMRWRDQQAGRSVALVAEYQGRVAGYINVYRQALDGPDAFRALPEIVDFGVFIPFRNHGVGTRLMDAAEDIAAAWSDTVCLAVGLHSGYGSAQRMYVKRGYVPDGSGVWYQGRVCGEYDPCCNDDDLVLFLSKKLR